MLKALWSRVQPLLGLLVLYALTLAWAWYAGKDISWDQINYHLYVVDLWWSDRLGQDYYAASIQSYLNPLSYVPFFAMVMADWNDLVIALVLATLQFGGVVAIWRLYPRLVPEIFAAHHGWRFLACLLGGVSPIYLVELGSSFSESLSGMLVLFALIYILPRHGAFTRNRALFAGGLLMGAATALKLTNGIFPVAALSLLAWPMAGDRKSILRRLCAFAGGCVAAFMLFQGYFSWRLWQQFGNPFFPFFNSIFKSPGFLLEDIQDRMFLGQGFSGFFTLPWDLMSWRSYIHFEWMAVDGRLLALTLLGVACVLVHVLRRLHDQSRATASVADGLVLATWFFIVSLALWAWTTHIGRYAMPLWLLLGPLFVAWLLHFFPSRQDWAMLLVVTIIALQCLFNMGINAKRWTPVAYSGKWFDLTLPESAKKNNSLFLSTQNLSPSFLVPYLPEDASFVNIINRQYVVPAGNKIPPNFAGLLSQKNPIFLYMFMGNPDMQTAEMVLRDQNAWLAIYGVEFEVCEGGAAHFLQHRTGAPLDYALFFCPLRRLDDEETRAAVAFVNGKDAVFSRIEAACPEWFSPSGMQTLSNGKVWWRDYFNTRTRITVDKQGEVYGGAQGVPNSLHLGSADRLLLNAPIDCPAPVVARYDR